MKRLLIGITCLVIAGGYWRYMRAPALPQVHRSKTTATSAPAVRVVAKSVPTLGPTATPATSTSPSRTLVFNGQTLSHQEDGSAARALAEARARWGTNHAEVVVLGFSGVPPLAERAQWKTMAMLATLEEADDETQLGRLLEWTSKFAQERLFEEAMKTGIDLSDPEAIPKAMEKKPDSAFARWIWLRIQATSASLGFQEGFRDGRELLELTEVDG